MDFGDAFDDLVETGFWIEAALVFVGFVIPVIAQNVIESRFRDLPNEVYGAGTALGALAMGQSSIAAGGGVYAVDALAQRLEVKGAVTSMGGA